MKRGIAVAGLVGLLASLAAAVPAQARGDRLVVGWRLFGNFNQLPEAEDAARSTSTARGTPRRTSTRRSRSTRPIRRRPRTSRTGNRLGTKPFYARQYVRVPNVNHGLYQPFDDTGPTPDTLQWDLTPTPTYHDLVDIARIVTPGTLGRNDAAGLNGFTRYWNRRAGEPWLCNPTSGRFISYEDPRSVHERTQAPTARVSA